MAGVGMIAGGCGGCVHLARDERDDFALIRPMVVDGVPRHAR